MSGFVDHTLSKPRSFCPLILFHNNPPEKLSIELRANQQQNRTAIDRHLDRTNEMLEHNAYFWTSTSLDETKETIEKDIRVSPSTSTTSNLSCSSSSSGDSIATIDSAKTSLLYKSVTPPSNLSGEISPVYYSTPPTPKPLFTASSDHFPSKKQTNLDPAKKRRRGNLPKEVTEFLRKWLIQHKKHPYPAEKEKIDLARHTGLTVNQISNWFINARRRILQPMLESENLAQAQMMAYPEYETRRRRSEFFHTTDYLGRSFNS
ncbi:hypothetical protein K501DRAFT_289775 [Backusella circina FSU 941]|nr:hypothetical protein K501DRAFT_289775 [Backusella circina FSU 941]